VSSRRAIRFAAGLWITWAIIVWNVVFDHVIVVAGRSYVAAAGRAARVAGPFARMDDWMRPAVTHGFMLASLSALALLAIGFSGIRAATRAK
jgi:hypothetical protein